MWHDSSSRNIIQDLGQSDTAFSAQELSVFTKNGVIYRETEISKNGERFLKLFFPGSKPLHLKQGRTTKNEAEELTLLDKECIPYTHIYILHDILLEARGHYIISDLQEGDVHTHCPSGASALHAETHRSSGTGTRAWSAALSPAAGAARCAHP